MELHLLEAIAVAAEWWRGNYNSQWSSLRVKYEQIQGYQKIILNQYKPISKFCLCLPDQIGIKYVSFIFVLLVTNQGFCHQYD